MTTDGVTVYKHTSPSGKVYIGITCQKPESRWQGGRGYRHNEYFFRAILKYGWENFTHEILHSGMSKSEACNVEIALIASHRSTEREPGYNIASGGEFAEHTAETRKKMGNAHRGKPLAPEHRQKIGDAQRGRKLSPERCRKISESQIGRKPTMDTRRKLSEARKGKHHSADTIRKLTELKRDKMKAVLCVETGVIYPSISEAARLMDCSQGNISMCCLGQRNTACGFHWEYINE